MKKLALIRKERKSEWKSCQSITQSLFLSYKELESDNLKISVFDFPRGAGSFEGKLLAKTIFEEGITHVIFIDHEPHPFELVNALAHKYEESKNKPSLIFHIFGDFILQSPAWQRCEKALTSFKVSLVCASSKQQDLVNKLLADKNNSQVIPFPLEQNSMKFDMDLRARAREFFDLKDSFTFIYTGRLSYQKNVLDLIHSFAKLKETTGANIKLVMAGPMDDLGAPYLGKEGLAGTFFYHWEEVTRCYPDLLENGDFVYLGNLEAEKLKELYLAADAYISLSAHNDEDYGISPAEALASGLPCILSAWGGFASFKEYFSNQVLLCPIELGARRHKCSTGVVFKNMIVVMERGVDPSRRESDSANVAAKIGHRSISTSISNEVLKREIVPFSGFNDVFIKLSSVFETSPSAPFRGPDGGFSQFYLSLYRDYAGEV